jgi:hypothetical protein
MTVRGLSIKYGAGCAAINNLYREWRYDPMMTRAMARFNREFVIEGE